MKQEDAAGKILMELLKLEIITEEDEWVVYNYLKQAYATGYDEGRSQPTKRKPIIQYNLDGKPIKIFVSSRAAARAMKVTNQSIRNALSKKRPTCAGFKWEYVDTTKSTASEEQTIESLSKGLEKQVQETHASKKKKSSQ